jgi:hypothetical protein
VSFEEHHNEPADRAGACGWLRQLLKIRVSGVQFPSSGVTISICFNLNCLVHIVGVIRRASERFNRRPSQASPIDAPYEGRHPHPHRQKTDVEHRPQPIVYVGAKEPQPADVHLTTAFRFAIYRAGR